MLLTGSGSVRCLSSVVFVADGHPFCRAEGDFVPVSEDDPASSSLATGVAIVRPRVFDQPPLSQNDYLVDVPVNTVPVGGRLSLFVDHWVKITQDHFILSVVRQGFLISVQNYFPGVLREVTVPPRDPRVLVAICEEIQELIQKNAIVQIDDFPLLCLSPIFVIPKKTGSSGNFELEENQCVHSGSTFPDGNTECNSTGIAPSGLGRFVRLEGRLPSRADSPSVQETAGFQVSRQDLRVQGLAVRPKRLSVGLFKASCYGNSTPSPAGHPHILLSGRLAHRRRVSIGPSVTSSNHSSVGSESGVHCQSKEVGVYPSEDARLPRSFSRYPQVNCASGRTQSFGSSVAHPGTRRVSDGSCPPVAESSRTFGQPCGSGSKLQASHAASSVALPSILYPSVRLSVEADSDVSRNQGSVCSLGVSGSSPRRETVLPTPPPTPWY